MDGLGDGFWTVRKLFLEVSEGRGRLGGPEARLLSAILGILDAPGETFGQHIEIWEVLGLHMAVVPIGCCCGRLREKNTTL